jgi:hypothetical protein
MGPEAPPIEESGLKRLLPRLHPLDAAIARELTGGTIYGQLGDAQLARLLPLLAQRRTRFGEKLLSISERPLIPRIEVLPGTGGTQRLSRMVGKSKAIELIATGNTFSFEEAQEFGIVNDIFDRENFMESVMEYARQFCPPNKAAKAVGRIKRSIQTGWEIPMEAALAVERANQQLLFQSEDAKEGLAAYVEKRPATFTAK